MHSRPYLDFFLLPLWRCSRRKCQKMNDREKRSAFVSSWQIEPNRAKSKETLRISFRMPNAKWPADRQRQLVRPSLYPPQPRPPTRPTTSGNFCISVWPRNEPLASYVNDFFPFRIVCLHFFAHAIGAKCSIRTYAPRCQESFFPWLLNSFFLRFS